MISGFLERRNLVIQLVLKDLKLKYSRPVLGIYWAFLSPLLVVAIFYLVFSLILKVKTQEAPFILYLMSAVFTWRFFQESVTSSVTSLLDNKNLIRESRFPHYLVPLSIVLASLVNFLPSLVILVIAALAFNGFTPLLILLPFVLVIQFVLTVGVAFIVAFFYVKRRDLKYVLDVLMLLLFYLTPAFYSLFLVKESFSKLLYQVYLYNPLTGILTLYRMALLKDYYTAVRNDINLGLLISLLIVFAFAMLSLGIYLFKKNKLTINDYLAY